MSEYVDHAAEAMALMSVNLRPPATREGTNPEADRMIAEAQVHATLALVEQRRIASKLVVALVDQLAEIAKMLPGPGYPVDPAIRVRGYLADEEWEGLGL